MRTNVSFKSGVNLVCERVNKASMLSFLYFEEISPNKATELMNECLKNGWEFTQLDSDGLRISVPNDQIERFSTVL